MPVTFARCTVYVYTAPFDLTRNRLDRSKVQLFLRTPSFHYIHIPFRTSCSFPLSPLSPLPLATVLPIGLLYEQLKVSDTGSPSRWPSCCNRWARVWAVIAFGIPTLPYIIIATYDIQYSCRRATAHRTALLYKHLQCNRTYPCAQVESVLPLPHFFFFSFIFPACLTIA